MQYIAVAAGGNHQLDTPRGDDLFVFALRGRAAQQPAASYGEAQYERSDPVRYGAVRQVQRRARRTSTP
ncbi:MAG: hypothetical protein HY703_09905 [Gemmatimonadetes bacterium]|nr:hypothetical protein [Gemmatimonadota bacterium]